MQTFISWSGERSGEIAKALSELLGTCIQASNPWVSKSIDSGKRWDAEIAEKLRSSNFGIFCVLRENAVNPWPVFECGAISSNPDASVCPLLFDMKPTEVTGPLASFQARTYSRDEVWSLFMSINKSLGTHAVPEQRVREIFDSLWARFAEVVEASLKRAATPPAPERTTHDLVEEVLLRVRELSERQIQSRSRRDQGIPRRIYFPYSGADFDEWVEEVERRGWPVLSTGVKDGAFVADVLRRGEPVTLISRIHGHDQSASSRPPKAPKPSDKPDATQEIEGTG